MIDSLCIKQPTVQYKSDIHKRKLIKSKLKLSILKDKTFKTIFKNIDKNTE